MYYWKDSRSWEGSASTWSFAFLDPKICSHVFRVSLRWRRFPVWRMVPWWLAPEIEQMNEWPLPSSTKGGILLALSRRAPPSD